MADKIGLIILDGWGIGDGSSSDAIYHAKTPYMDHLLTTFPNSMLLTSGEDVGLPAGQMGNSEVGHLNIGAGRIVYQELTRINKSIREGEFFKNPVLVEAFENARKKQCKLHLIGLVSKGGVHSNQEHIYALAQMAKEYGIEKAFVHAFTDGRDCDPKSGLGFIKELEHEIQGTGVRIASLVGRYFAMDRDNRWERVRKAYDLLVHGKGEAFNSAKDAIQQSYKQGITDEFLEPAVIQENGEALGRIEAGDTVICFNFRTDRPREISIALTQRPIEEQEMRPLALDYYTMTNYDATFSNVKVIFEKDNLSMTLGETLSLAGKSQVRIAETEKYPHVTFFFSGGREKEFAGETRIMVNSPKVATYDLQPEMSALEVRDRIVEEIENQAPDFICLNFANPDMVGHTGVYSAIQKAVETVDDCLRTVVEAGRKKGYEFLIIADHGNADYAINEDGSPNTAHSLNPVPVILVSDDPTVQLNPGILADVAPTLLSRLGLAPAHEMTGTSLVKA